MTSAIAELAIMSIITTSMTKPLKELRVPHLLPKNLFLKVKFLIILSIKLHFLSIYKRQSLNYYIILEISFPYFRNDFKCCLFGQRFFFSIFSFKSTTIFRNTQENREKFYKKLSGSIRGGWYHILARIRTEIQSHTFLRCATSPVALPYEPSVSSPILPAWEKSSNYCFIYMYHKPID